MSRCQTDASARGSASTSQVPTSAWSSTGKPPKQATKNAKDTLRTHRGRRASDGLQLVIGTVLCHDPQCGVRAMGLLSGFFFLSDV